MASGRAGSSLWGKIWEGPVSGAQGHKEGLAGTVEARWRAWMDSGGGVGSEHRVQAGAAIG